MSWTLLGYPPPDPPDDPDPLDPVVEMANAYVEAVTGRLLDSSMPTTLDDLALQAVSMRTAQIVYGFQADMIESSVDDSGVISFTVPGYSETRAATGRNIYKEGLMNPWRALHELLWLLMTPEKQEEWTYIMTGVNPPAVEYTEVDWTAPYRDGIPVLPPEILPPDSYGGD